MISSNIGGWALAALAVAAIATGGCSSEMPFDMAPVHGKITYEDGSLIPADAISLRFNPIDVAKEGKKSPPGGVAEVNVEDGTFSSASSHRPNDGLVVGRHQVVVIALQNNSPINVVPPKYRKQKTTPLEVDVTSPDQFIELKVSNQ